MSMALNHPSGQRSNLKMADNLSTIRVQTAEIRCGWNYEEYKRRREEARRRQEELLGFLAPDSGVASAGEFGRAGAAGKARRTLANLSSRKRGGAATNPYDDNLELLAILGALPGLP